MKKDHPNLERNPRQQAGALLPVIVLKAYRTSDGEPVCDVTDSYGNVWRRCKILVPAGQDLISLPQALTDLTDQDAIRRGDGQALVAFGPGYKPHPFVIGHTLRIGALSRQIVGDSETPACDGPSGGDGAADVVDRSNGVRTSKTGAGQYIIDTAEKNQAVKVIVGKDQKLLITRGEYLSDTALLTGQGIERLLLGRRWQEYTKDELVDKILDCQNNIEALRGALTTLVAALVTPAALDPATKATVQAALAAIPPAVPPADPDNTTLSSVVCITDATE